MKFRVPVPLNARDENGKLTHDYQNANTNTSRDTGNVSNSKFFETNFEGILPVHVYVEFGGEQQTGQQTGQDVQVGVQVEQTVDEFVERIKKGEQMTSPEDLQFYDNNKKEIEAKLAEDFKPLPELTEDDIMELSFKEIRARLTPEQVKRVDKWAEVNGFESIDNFFASAESNHPDEQVYFKDYLIQCLL